ncbi:hypothetical protein C8R44DRAFT_736128 [Mycena epipterygia]|nr:hypothetical protein C8R44DRAFT_736128 [Mycena epipterygia]
MSQYYPHTEAAPVESIQLRSGITKDKCRKATIVAKSQLWLQRREKSSSEISDFPSGSCLEESSIRDFLETDLLKNIGMSSAPISSSKITREDNPHANAERYAHDVKTCGVEFPRAATPRSWTSQYRIHAARPQQGGGVRRKQPAATNDGKSDTMSRRMEMLRRSAQHSGNAGPKGSFGICGRNGTRERCGCTIEDAHDAARRNDTAHAFTGEGDGKLTAASRFTRGARMAPHGPPYETRTERVMRSGTEKMDRVAGKDAARVRHCAQDGSVGERYTLRMHASGRCRADTGLVIRVRSALNYDNITMRDGREWEANGGGAMRGRQWVLPHWPGREPARTSAETWDRESMTPELCRACRAVCLGRALYLIRLHRDSLWQPQRRAPEEPQQAGATQALRWRDGGEIGPVHVFDAPSPAPNILNPIATCSELNDSFFLLLLLGSQP